MSEIEEEFDQLLERTDPAELNMYSPIASQEMSLEELLGVVSAPADDTSGTSGMAPCDGACGKLRVGGDSCQGFPPSLMIMQGYAHTTYNRRMATYIQPTCIGQHTHNVHNIWKRGDIKQRIEERLQKMEEDVQTHNVHNIWKQGDICNVSLCRKGFPTGSTPGNKIRAKDRGTTEEDGRGRANKSRGGHREGIEMSKTREEL